MVQVVEINKKTTKRLPSDQYTDMLKKMRKDSEKLVKGMFEFIDAQGGWFDFSYRIFPGEPIQTYHFTHGEICEIPMGVVKHINNTKKKIRKFGIDKGGQLPERGLPSTYEVQSRIRFTPMDVL